MEAKLNILFIQIAETSYDESLLISRMISQLNEEVQVLCLANGISSSLISSNPGAIVGVLTENQDDNQQRFEALLQQVKPDVIVLLDLYKFFLNPLELNFLPVWLENHPIPVLALDYFNLLDSIDGRISLKPEVKLPHLEPGEGAEALESNAFLLKPLPMVQPEEGRARTFYWNPLDPALSAGAPQLRQQVLDSLGARGDTRVVTLLFDPTQFSQALERNLLGFFFIVVEVLIYYLRQFGGQKFQLLVIGSAPPTDQTNPIQDQNFEVHYFSHLTEDNYRALLAASDLLISNTTWSPALIDAAALGLPAAVMGNSIIQDWKDAGETEKELKSFFSPSPALYQLCEMMVGLNKWSLSLPIFPFINYPIRYEDYEFPLVGFKEASMPYFLLDMFDDENCLPIFQYLLFSQAHQQEYRELCQNWSREAQKGLSFSQILTKIRGK